MASLTRLPWWAQLGIFLVLSGAIAGAYYYYVETPAQERMVVQRRQLAEVEARIARGREAARQLGDFKRQVGELQARLESLKPILPDERDAGDLLRRVQTLAVQSSLIIRGFKPQPISMHEMHAEWPITLQIEGTYHNLGAFLDRVSKFPRIINIGALALTAKTEETAEGSINVTCVATTFVLVDNPPPPPPDTTKKGAPAKKEAAPAAKTE